MADKVQHPYECQSKGHVDSDRTFFAAPPEWWSGKGISTPKHCPACRAWMKEQTDESIRCKHCSQTVRISANSKKTHHMRVGTYEPITQCPDCESGKTAIKQLERRRRQKRREDEKRDDKPMEFSELAMLRVPAPRLLEQDPEWYKSQIITNDLTKQRESRYVHLQHHMPGSDHDWTSPQAMDQRGLDGAPKSVSSFAEGLTTPEELFAVAESYTSSVDGEFVREYIQKGRIVRVTFCGDHDKLEVTILKTMSNGRHELVSTYDDTTVDKVHSKLTKGWWT